MLNKLQSSLAAALERLGLNSSQLQLDRPKQISFGDITSNAPLVNAKIAHKAPMALAQEIVDNLELDPQYFASVDVAPPGFLNFKFSHSYLRSFALDILSSKENFGRLDEGAGKRALVEFVSANPTGPLTVGHGRGAMLGDTVANILDWNGYEVEREYYYNDAGRQMRVLGESVRARYLDQLGLSCEFPEDGYQGEYIRTIAQGMVNDHGDSLKDHDDTKIFTAAAEKAIFADINTTLEGLGVVFANYFNEQDLYDTGALDSVVGELESKGLIYQKEGASWLKASALGREDDRVLIKSTGEPTYRLPDIAYHANKLDRKFDLIIDIFGADHKETYPDVLAALKGLGYNTDPIRVLIHQFVTLTTGGQQVKMSTRKATFVTLDELMQDVGRDVVRYFFLMRGMDTHLNFDLDLARKASDENPVFYLQYAHARMVNVAKRAQSFGYTFQPDTANLDLLDTTEEHELMHLLWWFPHIISQAGKTLEPMSVANYLQEIATAYHRYYTVARVVTDDEHLSQARLVLTEACRQTIANGLSILGISAPERM